MRLLVAQLKEERERLNHEINKRDSTTTSKALFTYYIVFFSIRGPLHESRHETKGDMNSCRHENSRKFTPVYMRPDIDSI